MASYHDDGDSDEDTLGLPAPVPAPKAKTGKGKRQPKSRKRSKASSATKQTAKPDEKATTVEADPPAQPATKRRKTDSDTPAADSTAAAAGGGEGGTGGDSAPVGSSTSIATETTAPPSAEPNPTVPVQSPATADLDATTSNGAAPILADPLQDAPEPSLPGASPPVTSTPTAEAGAPLDETKAVQPAPAPMAVDQPVVGVTEEPVVSSAAVTTSKQGTAVTGGDDDQADFWQLSADVPPLVVTPEGPCTDNDGNPIPEWLLTVLRRKLPGQGGPKAPHRRPRREHNGPGLNGTKGLSSGVPPPSYTLMDSVQDYHQEFDSKYQQKAVPNDNLFGSSELEQIGRLHQDAPETQAEQAMTLLSNYCLGFLEGGAGGVGCEALSKTREQLDALRKVMVYTCALEKSSAAERVTNLTTLKMHVQDYEGPGSQRLRIAVNGL